jgi:hypothetical protein
MNTERSYSKEKEPDLFYERCKSHYLRDKRHIEESRAALLKDGVPEKYIFVCQTNRHDKLGDIYPYNDKERVENQLNSIRDASPPIVALPEGAFRFVCVDLRDRGRILELCTFSYIKEVLDEYLADVEGRTLEFDKQKDPSSFRNQRMLNRLTASNVIAIQYKKLKVNCPRFNIFVAHTKRNDPLKGELIPYTDKGRVFHAINTSDKGATVCHYPADDIFTCLDICNLPELRKYITPEAISDEVIAQIVRSLPQIDVIEVNTLEYIHL